jgi:hypothetical protein
MFDVALFLIAIGVVCGLIVFMVLNKEKKGKSDG